MYPEARTERSTLERLIAFRVLAAVGIVSSHCLVFQTPASLSTLEIRTLILVRDFGVAGFFLIGGVFLARAGFAVEYVKRRWRKVLPATLGVEFAFALVTVVGSWMITGHAAWTEAYWLWFIYFYLAALSVVALIHQRWGAAGVKVLFAATVAFALASSFITEAPSLLMHRTTQSLLEVSAGALIGLAGLHRLTTTPAALAVLIGATMIALRLQVEGLPATVLFQLVYALAVFVALPGLVVNVLGRIDFNRIRRTLFGIFLIHGFVVSAVSAIAELVLWGRIVPGNVLPAYSLPDMIVLWVATTLLVLITSAAVVRGSRALRTLAAG